MAYLETDGGRRTSLRVQRGVIPERRCVNPVIETGVQRMRVAEEWDGDAPRTLQAQRVS